MAHHSEAFALVDTEQPLLHRCSEADIVSSCGVQILDSGQC